MGRRGLGRVLLVAGAVLLLATASIHATGSQMIAGWTSSFDAQRQAALGLVWLTDSFDWAVTAAAWLIAARYPTSSWRSAAILLTLIRTVCAVGIPFIEPRFLGAYLLLGRVLFALTGASIAGNGDPTRPEQE